MFGDNLSFISDTTIAACNGQGCEMRDKFREDFKFAVPAAVVTIVIMAVMTINSIGVSHEAGPYDLVLIIPYLVVLIGGIIGFNVFVVLAAGIVSGTVVMLATGTVEAMDILPMIGSGMSGMLETSMVALLVAAICSLIAFNGGFEALLLWIKKVFKGKRAGMLGVGILVAAMDVATANNTVAIVMSNPIAKDISVEYGFSAKRTASLLDTFSCVMQGLLPYGAQMLIALSVIAGLGFTVSAFDMIPYLIYPIMPLVCVLLFIFLSSENRADVPDSE